MNSSLRLFNFITF